ncbi:hypothetical protein NLG97_g3662 [Lecanicillium saksenae]|uniref:Uncharacterized protein n=1 Tax=Lecanicillium saksenae TaxID=468837 RepID=A0ACC1QXF7_9HYPO|nr:hypothetical protein NLG97_g3662 [Lecanicillium saksenae]
MCTGINTNFTLFATAAQGCFCGFCTYENIKVTTESNCNLKCEAEPNNKCGGAKGDSIYVSLYGDKKSISLPGYITGLTQPTCYHYGDSALKGPSYTDTAEMTVKSCTEFCVQQHNMKTMILVKGDTCYCSDSNLIKDTSLTGCDAPCTGDQRQKCGGGNNGADYMSVWTLTPS